MRSSRTRLLENRIQVLSFGNVPRKQVRRDMARFNLDLYP